MDQMSGVEEFLEFMFQTIQRPVRYRWGNNSALRRFGHCGREELTVNKPCLEPLLENPLVRWDIGPQPVMVYVVKAAFDIPSIIY
ncbi:hypothetical protein LFE_1335 [Leptospirillum ferrooxidans C2-3]|uniref:Uncharacterized protein n=1 Tax=Leptospirillum ferrooxidans (strain C2-3) TaxID=1162668 RepID=I0IP19_LEPFC|nr:hypothetical protein LFE_1335 [Leptospirillum ferrooxidans C2-3]